MPDMKNEIDNNYQIALERYRAKKQSLLEKLSQESQEGYQDFLQILNTNYIDLLSTKQASAMTGREVKIQTILNQVYKKAEEVARTAIQDPNNVVYDSEIEEIRRIQSETKGEAEKVKKAIDDEVTKIAERFQISNSVQNIVNYMIPQMSSENQKLTADQVQGYVRAKIKQNILQQASMVEMQKAVRKYPSILYGYYREDATAEAAIRAIEYLSNKENAMVFSTGFEKTSVDILISMDKKFNSQTSKNKELFKEILKNLDSLNGEMIVHGEAFNTDDFYGIQAKPWNLAYLKNPNNKIENSRTTFTVGSRAFLKEGFLQSLGDNNIDPIDSKRGWHRGVLYLSQNLSSVVGANTVLYAVHGQVIGTDELLQIMLDTNRYFAFVITEKNKVKELSSTIEIADHYG